MSGSLVTRNFKIALTQDEALNELKRETGKSRSELVREGIAMRLEGE